MDNWAAFLSVSCPSPQRLSLFCLHHMLSKQMYLLQARKAGGQDYLYPTDIGRTDHGRWDASVKVQEVASSYQEKGSSPMLITSRTRYDPTAQTMSNRACLTLLISPFFSRVFSSDRCVCIYCRTWRPRLGHALRWWPCFLLSELGLGTTSWNPAKISGKHVIGWDIISPCLCIATQE